MGVVPEVDKTEVVGSDVHGRRKIIYKSNSHVFPITHVISNNGAASYAFANRGNTDADVFTAIVGEERPVDQIRHMLSILRELSVQGVDGC